MVIMTKIPSVPNASQLPTNLTHLICKAPKYARLETFLYIFSN